jgi:inosine-uridine nucleoside N-ribohydrolase
MMRDSFRGWKPDRRSFLSGSGGIVLAAILDRSTVMRGQSNATGKNQGPAVVQKVIIDTDPGVDDAFALLLAMRSPELRIEAITAVAGNGPLSLTLPNALRMVEVADRTDIPVAGGASSPLIRRLWVGSGEIHGKNGLGGAEFPVPRTQPVKEPAADLICRVVRENPGEIAIIGIGPLTNVALALRQDPQIANLIPKIVLMGGALKGGNATPSAEFNFWADPEAASIVFDSGIPITMVGLDVTMKVELTPNYIQQLEAGRGKVCVAAAQIARKLTELYQSQGRVTGKHMHDPLAVAALIRPEIVDLEDYHVEIETAGNITAGESVGWKTGPLSYSEPLQTITADGQPIVAPFHVNTKVATSVYPERFFDLFIDRITKG